MISDRLALVEAVNEIGSLTAEKFDEKRHLAMAQEVVDTLDSRVTASYVFSATVPAGIGKRSFGKYEERLGEYRITKYRILPPIPINEMIFEHFQTGLNEDMYDVDLPRIAIVYHQKSLKLCGLMVQENRSFTIPFLFTYISRGSKRNFLWAGNNLIRHLF